MSTEPTLQTKDYVGHAKAELAQARVAMQAAGDYVDNLQAEVEWLRESVTHYLNRSNPESMGPFIDMYQLAEVIGYEW